MSSRQCPAEGFNPRPAGWGGATTVCRKRINLLPVSIHAPPVGAGRLRGLPLRLARTRRFNPRPAGWGGATRYCTNGGAVTCVSIHAPPVGAGRRSGAFRMRRDSAFQSTPRRLGRGDSFQPYGSESPIGFNPRPAGWGGATASVELSPAQGLYSRLARTLPVRARLVGLSCQRTGKNLDINVICGRRESCVGGCVAWGSRGLHAISGSWKLRVGLAPWCSVRLVASSPRK